MSVSPPEARAHVALEHARVATLVTAVTQASLPTEERGLRGWLRGWLMGLREAIEHTIDVEERELIPILRDADAWGPVRVVSVREHHARILCALLDFERDLAIHRQRGAALAARADDLVMVLWTDLDVEDDAFRITERDEQSTVMIDQETG